MITAPAVAQASTLAANRRWNEALRVLGPHLSTSPDDARGWCLAAQCHLGLQDPRLAFEAARNALGCNPESEWAHRVASIALSGLGRHADARMHAGQAIRLAPHSWLGHRQRAEVDIAAKDVTAQTWAAARRAVDLAPEEPATHLTYGRVALVTKDNQTATDAFRRALAIDPQNAVARNNLAVVQLRRRRFRSAAQHLIGALRISPDSGLFAYNLRVVLRAWAMTFNVLTLIACVVAIGVTSDRVVRGPDRIVSVPTTIGPGLVASMPTRVPLLQHVHVTGRPGALVISAAIVVLALLLVWLHVMHTLGAGAGRILRGSIVRDPLLALTIGTSVLGVAALATAAATGMPFAHDIATGLLVYEVVSLICVRVLGRRERRLRLRARSG